MSIEEIVAPLTGVDRRCSCPPVAPATYLCTVPETDDEVIKEPEPLAEDIIVRPEVPVLLVKVPLTERVYPSLICIAAEELIVRLPETVKLLNKSDSNISSCDNLKTIAF